MTLWYQLIIKTLAILFDETTQPLEYMVCQQLCYFKEQAHKQEQTELL